ncbi:helix-turn-helix domain-containing protein [Rhodococcus sp. HM1]|uniref:helix-turn-helix transcriptional regulator n=1 Tax=Rhodococcus sp. HM1 TaxID=2937759 RepID=UPI00200ADF69|nr:helix-turn-helix domain-containing protein [Rhodococcus sp. HM1]MCK8671022.1 helix-turn-helix domain-containing protein [Rhodococcus sp. HM1]
MADERLATGDEVAEYLRTSRQQMATWRYRGTGPKYVKVGRRPLYRWSDVEAWLDANTKTRTDDAA